MLEKNSLARLCFRQEKPCGGRHALTFLCVQGSVCKRRLAGGTSQLIKCKTSNHNHLSKHSYSKECDHSHLETVDVKSEKECVRFKQ